ncbi:MULTISPECIES: LysE family translocator [Pseudomonas]|jgi:RhtB (resistance to homoserine/threonine) family protein|uniref:LysE family transporter n=1 Tax=Pseudomonas tehranensis TaxID=2745502 RepID=A0ABR6UNA5_9PSED|nr:MULTISPECIES: LysE family transporter [Pseudomonas]MBC3346044.1 LysE family transporter [Pseudomonas tehranensis]SEO73494.1 resistance to homoserine/threonine (RhtB) family protein [Pseudomonas sp. NFACC39-1]SFH32299.1 resistance to homoserine/threonine (RhtB) family protein [Pseudomonas sp. NFACC45]
MLSSYLGEFLALATVHFLAVVAPGPDFAVTIRQSVRFGRWIGICTALGIGAGISVHVIYTLLGVGALMHTFPWLLMVAKVVGGAYILYLGVSLLRSQPKSTLEGVHSNDQDTTGQTPFKAFVTGFLTNATNPKATLFFLAIFTTLISTTTPLQIQALYGLWMCLVNALWFVLVALFFSSARVREVFMRMGHWFERSMGVILILFAGRLILSL